MWWSRVSGSPLWMILSYAPPHNMHYESTWWSRVSGSPCWWTYCTAPPNNMHYETTWWSRVSGCLFGWTFCTAPPNIIHQETTWCSCVSCSPCWMNLFYRSSQHHELRGHVVATCFRFPVLTTWWVEDAGLLTVCCTVWANGHAMSLPVASSNFHKDSPSDFEFSWCGLMSFWNSHDADTWTPEILTMWTHEFLDFSWCEHMSFWNSHDADTWVSGILMIRTHEFLRFSLRGYMSSWDSH